MFEIKYKTEEEQLAAVRQDGNKIQYIYNPTEMIQLEAVKQNGRAIQFIHNPEPSVIRYVIENHNDLEIIQSMRINFDELPDDLKLLLEIKF